MKLEQEISRHLIKQYTRSKSLTDDSCKEVPGFVVLNIKERTKKEKVLEDITAGVLGGTGIVHQFVSHWEDYYNGENYRPYKPFLYHSVKFITAGLESLGYYLLAKKGNEWAFTPLVTNFLGLMGPIDRMTEK